MSSFMGDPTLEKATHITRTVLVKSHVKLSSFYKKTPCFLQGRSLMGGSKVGSHRGSRGDTIIEVMLSIVLIGSAVALAVSMSNHNLNIGIGTTQRSQALSITQGQIERIRNAYINNDPVLNSYKSNQPYCILGDGSTAEVDAQDSKCAGLNGSQYTVSVVYSDATKIFTATTTWISNASGSGQDELKLSYK